MTILLWTVVVLSVVTFQVTWLHHAAIGDIRPDVCLALTSLIGFLRGERQGLLLGLGIGFAQDLASAGDFLLSMLTGGAAGLVSGVVGRRLVQPTILSFVTLVMSISCLTGILFLFSGRAINSFALEVQMVRGVLLPQAAYDSVVAAGLYWLLAHRIGSTGETESSPGGSAGLLSIK